MRTHRALAALLVEVIVDDLQQLGIPRQLEQDPLVQLGRGGGGGRGAGEVPEQEGTAGDGGERPPHLGPLGCWLLPACPFRARHRMPKDTTTFRTKEGWEEGGRWAISFPPFSSARVTSTSSLCRWLAVRRAPRAYALKGSARRRNPRLHWGVGPPARHPPDRPRATRDAARPVTY